MQNFIFSQTHFFEKILSIKEINSRPIFTNFIPKKKVFHKIQLKSQNSNYPQNGRFSRDKKKKTIYYTYFCFIYSLLGCIETFYLTISKLNDSLILCSDQNCSIVLNSTFSSFFNIPLSFFGFLVYFSLGTKLFNLIKIWDNKIIKKFSFQISTTFFSLVLSLFSTYFIFILEQVLKTSCPWCFFSIFLSGSLLIFLTFISSGDENINIRSSFFFISLIFLIIFSINSFNIIEMQNF